VEKEKEPHFCAALSHFCSPSWTSRPTVGQASRHKRGQNKNATFWWRFCFEAPPLGLEPWGAND